MARPIQKRFFNYNSNKAIYISGAKFRDGSTATNCYILSQEGTNIFRVSKFPSGGHAENLELVPASSVDQLKHMQCYIQVITYSGNILPVIKITQNIVYLLENSKIKEYRWSARFATQNGEANVVNNIFNNTGGNAWDANKIKNTLTIDKNGAGIYTNGYGGTGLTTTVLSSGKKIIRFYGNINGGFLGFADQNFDFNNEILGLDQQNQSVGITGGYYIPNIGYLNGGVYIGGQLIYSDAYIIPYAFLYDLAIDIDNKKLYIRVNDGAWLGGDPANPETGIDISSLTSTNLVFAITGGEATMSKTTGANYPSGWDFVPAIDPEPPSYIGYTIWSGAKGPGLITSATVVANDTITYHGADEPTALAGSKIALGDKVVFSSVLVTGATVDWTGIGIGDIYMLLNDYIGFVESIGIFYRGYSYGGTNTPPSMDANFNVGDTLDFALDRVNHLMWFRYWHNGTPSLWNGSGSVPGDLDTTNGFDLSQFGNLDLFPGFSPYTDDTFQLLQHWHRYDSLPAGFRYITTPAGNLSMQNLEATNIQPFRKVVGVVKREKQPPVKNSKSGTKP